MITDLHCVRLGMSEVGTHDIRSLMHEVYYVRNTYGVISDLHCVMLSMSGAGTV